MINSVRTTQFQLAAVVASVVSTVPAAQAWASDGNLANLTGRISCGDAHSCAVKSDGAIKCWGANNYGQAPPVAPEGTFKQVSSGRRHTCALKTDGKIICSGSNDNITHWQPTGQAKPPDGTFLQVSAGGYHTCGLRSDSVVLCWGNNRFGQAEPPQGRFVQVSAGARHTCGILDDARVICWGDNKGDQAPPQASVGKFKEVSAGFSHTCAIDLNGQVHCWGNNRDHQAPESVEGLFAHVSAGVVHTCGVKTDGSVTCWGSNKVFDNLAGFEVPPEGKFNEVSAGLAHTCGFRTNGEVACWGANKASDGTEYGQATPPVDLAPNQPFLPGLDQISKARPSPEPVSAQTPQTARTEPTEASLRQDSQSRLGYWLLAGIAVIVVVVLSWFVSKQRQARPNGTSKV